MHIFYLCFLKIINLVWFFRLNCHLNIAVLWEMLHHPCLCHPDHRVLDICVNEVSSAYSEHLSDVTIKEFIVIAFFWLKNG